MDYWDNSKNQRAQTNHNDHKNYTLLIAIAIVSVVISAYFIFNIPSETQAISGEVIRRLRPQAQIDIEKLQIEPCNRPIAEDLVVNLINSAEYTATLSFIKYNEQKCGYNKQLLTGVFLAKKGLSDFSGAEETATKLLEENPESPNIYIWRAEAKENRGNLQGAYEDLKKGLSLFPDPSRVISKVFYDLAKLAAKTNQPCEAVAVLQDYVSFDNIQRHTPQVISLIQKWQKDGSCPAAFGSGTVRLHYNPADSAIIMPVEVNGTRSKMIIDTGASRTVLTKSFANKVGIKPQYNQGSMTNTANGKVWQMGGRAKHISLGGASANNVPIFIQTTDKGNFGDGIDGLLGLSFLGNFKFSINKGILELQSLE